MFPFQRLSLTSEVEKIIHATVRKSQPTKYYIFRLADFLAKSASIFMFVIFMVYMSVWTLSTHLQKMSPSDLDALANPFAIAFVAAGIIGVSTHIIQDGLRHQLKGAVRDACKNI